MEKTIREGEGWAEGGWQKTTLLRLGRRGTNFYNQAQSERSGTAYVRACQKEKRAGFSLRSSS